MPGVQKDTDSSCADSPYYARVTVKSISKKGGKVTTTQTSAVSSDGKSRTVTTTNGAGQTVNTVAVYDRQ